MPEKTEPKVYGVTELTDVIKGLFKPFDKIYVEGEISGWKVYSSGHAYFTLKDAGAQISCVMFASAIQRCKAAPRLCDGAKVCLYGRLDVYAARGSYQLIVLAAKIAGEGDLMAKFNELKEKLEKEGLFDAARKRPLPFLPHRIAIVTSPSGAVIHDMCTVLSRRFPNFDVRLYPVKVQGPGAKEEIVEGIKFFNRPSPDWKPDVLIVARGGGSIEDLWAFNEECVARAVAASTIPVISAVGHETDFTLCDFAADKRAGTPSIAAEIVVPPKEKLLQQIRELSARLVLAPQHACETYAQRIDHASMRLAAAPQNACVTHARRIDRAAMRLAVAPRQACETCIRRVERATFRLASALKDAIPKAEMRLARCAQSLSIHAGDAVTKAEMRLTRCAQSLSLHADNAVTKAEMRLSAAKAKLVLLDPANPLKRGYSLTLDANGSIVRSAKQLHPGDVLTTRLSDGSVESTVIDL